MSTEKTRQYTITERKLHKVMEFAALQAIVWAGHDDKLVDSKDYKQWIKNNEDICLGTDSFATAMNSHKPPEWVLNFIRGL